jgi:hypothetical protein
MSKLNNPLFASIALLAAVGAPIPSLFSGPDKPRREFTPEDQQRLDKAATKRARKNAKRLRDAGKVAS